jgi:hypothetical protein
VTKLYKVNSHKALEKILTFKEDSVIIFHEGFYKSYYQGINTANSRTEQMARLDLAVAGMRANMKKFELQSLKVSP